MSIIGLPKSIDRQAKNGSSVSSFSRRSQSSHHLLHKQSAIWQPGQVVVQKLLIILSPMMFHP
jgi:hypothetical protein